MAAADDVEAHAAAAALARIGRVLGINPRRPASRLEMLRRFQALDANASGILTSAELIDGRARRRGCTCTPVDYEHSRAHTP
jgi:hypothetical protein